ncbi:putative ribosomal large subunit assembly and maintenance-related protein [Leucosporidium creatinivorum]|uniref:Putative ribosomal large subunit assembly and maintenance-related protein n=1 Tax=Leucosporidium creatinivorum TaxID=106004 RepID=A0A1Y2FTQ0_9BASI|nr:putative ribosomal large subunit assembly and maintenance-related protein [Leucosporidium creatinivorum]
MAPTSLTKDLKRKRGDGEATEEAPRPPYKQRVLVLSSRGISQRQRHLMNDLTGLLPHAKKDAKLDSKHQLPLVNELCDLSSCNNALFFEARRKYNDLYLWAAKAPNGPSIRFHVLNTHTMDELKMTGNCLKGSRPIVVFDKQFDESPHFKVIKEVLMNIFAVPKTARRAKPFVDHVLNISIADGKIWFRNYQILDIPPADTEAPTSSSTGAKGKAAKQDGPKMSLNEIGPRFVLQPVKIFEGSFNGATLYENKEFVPSSSVAGAYKNARASKYKGRKGQQEERKVRKEEIDGGKIENELETRSVFA